MEEERKARTKKIAKEKKITTEDCLVIGILRLNSEINMIYKRMEEMERRINGRIDEIEKRIDEMDRRINSRIDSNFRWTLALILGMWVTMVAMLTPILLKLVGMI